MPQPDPLQSPTLEHKALIWLLVGFSAAFALILVPFIGAVLWAIFIAIVFAPLHRRILERTGGRDGIASLISLTLIILIVILPLSLLGASVVQEAGVAYQKVKAGEIPLAQYFQRALDALPSWARSLLERYGLGDLATLQQQATALATRSGQLITTYILNFGQNTLDFLVAFFAMLYLLFFLLRDGRPLSAAIARTIPLERRQTERLLAQFVTVVRATVKGNIVIALIQGALGGLAFWVLGLPGPLLWGTMMAILSLLPAVGAALVWIPVAVYYLATGQIVQAVGLTAWGVLVIGLVDNLLRPVLVGKDTNMPDYLVLFTTLGGIAVFGINGFVIGPVIAAMFLVGWDMFTAARLRGRGQAPVREERGNADAEDAPPRERRPRRRRRPSSEPPAQP